MSKISLMGSGAFDVYCPTKRVYFRPAAPADTIRVGDQICYNSDSILDHKERAADPSHLGLTQDTYEEGAQEFTGRLFIVEKPATANLHAYAGVVKSLGPEAGGDGDMIEIWVPTEGAIVPVMSDQNCTNERTIIGVRNGAYEASYPGRAIGVAVETKDRSSVDGLIWMKFKSFIWQFGDDSALTIDDEGSGNDVTLNKIKVTSALTTGSVNMLSLVLNTVNTDGGSMMYWEYGNTGTGAGGMKLINAYVEAAGTAIASDVVGMKMQVNLLAGSGSTTAATIMAIFAKVHVKASTGTHEGAVCAGRFSLGLDTAVTGIVAQLEFEHTGSQTPDYLFDAIYGDSIAYTADTSGTNQAGAIKIRIQGVDHYLHTFDSTVGAT